MVAAGGLLLVSCSGDDESSGADAIDSASSEFGTSDDDVGGADAEAYIQAAAESLLEEDPEQRFDEETATCVAAAHIDWIGVDVLVVADVSPQEFADSQSLDEIDIEVPDDAAPGLTVRLAECELGEPMRAGLVGEFTRNAGEELSPEAMACIEEVVDDQAAAEAVAITSVEGSDQGVTPLVGAVMAACPDITTALFVAEAPAPVTPEDEACVHAVLEANPDLTNSGFADRDTAARQELEGLIASGCPDVYD